MAVFTDLSRDETLELLAHYRLGDLVAVRGIASGIENSNFFLTTTSGEYVLTVFERLQAPQLPFYLGLMQHLAQRALPVPEPFPTDTGQLHALVRGKPAAIVTRLPGRAVERPDVAQCAQVGAFLARMHLAAGDYTVFQPNLRGLGWWKDASVALEPHLPDAIFHELLEEVIFQDSAARRPEFEQLPAGPIHADLFRDNVLFDGPAIGGVIDFYFAGCGAWLFDLAVAVNDWCIELDTGRFRAAEAQALLQAYHGLRPLGALEADLWRTMLRAAALRFWISRLYDWHLPRPATVLQPKDPDHFERILRLRVTQPDLPWVHGA
jgi:homoserine kinase type II